MVLALRPDGLAPCWTAFAGANAAITAVDGQTIIVSTEPCPGRSDGSSDLIALDTATGKELWRADGAGMRYENEEFGVHQAGDHVLLMRESSPLQARDTRTGEVLWEVADAAAVADGPDFVVLARSGATVVVADRRTGTPRWEVENVLGDNGVVADAASVLLTDGEGANTTAYDARSGKERWTAAFSLKDSGGGEDLYESIVIGGVVIGLRDERSQGRDISTGQVIWTSKATPALEMPHDSTGQIVVAFLPDDSTAVLDARTGKTRWAPKEPAFLQPGPDIVLAWTERGVSGLDIETGKKRWTVATSKLDTLPGVAPDTGDEPTGPEEVSRVVGSDRAFFSYVNCSPEEGE